MSEHAEVDKGDRVFIFMSRTPELYFALLGVLENWCNCSAVI
ncbi:hypothetical protein UM876_12265 [Staphylococcus aureus]|nr:hypothetical protein UM876_12265 [Staphylococcus aureus]